MSDSVFCTNCGAQMSPEARFCNNCGTTPGQKPPIAKKKKSLLKRWWFWTGVGVILLIGIISNSSSSSQKAVSAPPAATTTTKSTQDQAKDDAAAKAKVAADAKAKAAADAKAKADADAKQKAELKSEAEITLNKFNSVVDEYNQVDNNLQSVISGLADGSVDQVTAYDVLTKLSDQSLQVFSDAESLQIIDRYAQSKETLTISVSELRSGIKELRDYLDTPKTSTLAQAKDDLQQANNGINLVNVAVAAQAIKDGYTPPSDKK